MTLAAPKQSLLRSSGSVRLNRIALAQQRNRRNLTKPRPVGQSREGFVRVLLTLRVRIRHAERDEYTTNFVRSQGLNHNKRMAANSFTTDGYLLLRSVVGPGERARLLRAIAAAESNDGVRQRRGATYAIRDLLWSSTDLRDALMDIGIDQLVSDAIGRNAFPIDAMLFDKHADANWTGPGHQDLVMPVAGEVFEDGFEGWVMRRNGVYVELPAAALSDIVAARIHLDDAPAENGALAVVPGSHTRGRLRDSDLAGIALSEYTVCDALAGDVLLMRPLLVHCSSPARDPGHRRVLHVVYATREPGKLVRWRETIETTK